jgi:hypothetical protein
MVKRRLSRMTFANTSENDAAALLDYFLQRIE